MKLEDMYICLDCEEIFEKPIAGFKVFCPSCGSEQSHPISKWIVPLYASKRGRSCH